MQAMSLMHIPKTGGTAMAHALDRYVHRMGHETRLEAMPIWPPIITVVRDPVERWVSAWDMCLRQRRHVPEYERWPDASTAALDPEALDWLESYWGRAFTPQVFWLRDAKYALRRTWYICHTETLSADFEIIRDAIGAVGCEMPTKPRLRNANPAEKSVLSPEAEAAIRDRYAADYRLLKELSHG
jgi:hypothetical protein